MVTKLTMRDGASKIAQDRCCRDNTGFLYYAAPYRAAFFMVYTFVQMEMLHNWLDLHIRMRSYYAYTDGMFIHRQQFHQFGFSVFP